MNLRIPAGFALFYAATFVAFCFVERCPAETTPLVGEWRFALDRGDVGITEKWFAKELAGKIQLPGVLQAQGYGDDISTNTPWVVTLGDAWWKIQPAGLREPFSQPGRVKVPFLSQPPKHYLGAAWYQRRIRIPQSSANQHVSLFLERVHWKSTVWLDEKEYPSHDSLSTPHSTDFGALAPGEHRLTVHVDNRLQLPASGHLVDSHSISDALGATWNGIVGRIELRSAPLVRLDDIQLFPHLVTRSVTIKGRLVNMTGASGKDSIKMMVTQVPFEGNTTQIACTNTPVTWSVDGGSFEAELFLGSTVCEWNEFRPAKLKLAVGSALLGHQEVFFGLREITARDKDILINNHPVNMRMAHFGGDFPLTGYPAMEEAPWRKIFQACRDYGLNGMRFHSWCPPEAAFVAADALGFYLQPECGLWADFGNQETRAFLEAETTRIIKAYGNHPSFVMLAPSNEPKNYSRTLPLWAKVNYAKDSRRLYAAATGWSDSSQVIGGAQFATLVRYGKGQLRNSTGWFGGDYSTALEGVGIPVLSHEVGQWCAYPDFDVMKKFTGYMRPSNYEIFRYIAEQNGLSEMNKAFAWASGRFQLACYKEEIEANLRTPGLAGFQLLDLHDYLGQGTALIGVLDAFWEDKGYASSEAFRSFCGPVVPLAWLKKRIFTTDEKLEAAIGVAQFGQNDLTNALVRWEVLDDKNRVVGESQTRPAHAIPVGFKGKCLDVAMDLRQLQAPARYRLVARIKAGGTCYKNEWNWWLYPVQIEASKVSDVLITSNWSDAAKNLAAGGKVLFMPGVDGLDPLKCPPMRNVPVFWNIQMTVRPPQNPAPRFDAFLGLLCETNHPALSAFPTDRNCDWQWTAIIHNVRAINLAAAPRELKPIVWAIDDWNRSWRLGVIFECRVGTGRLLVSAINLSEDHRSPVARQLRRSLVAYMGSKQFEPVTALSLEQGAGLWATGASRHSEPTRVFDPDQDDGSSPRPVKQRKQK